ncbi:two-component system, response regulator YesN [Paenibacillus sp. yr247]|uniref:AraC family transcriptional regulator n=1 Tax=Paenibacillus sp. yr247 TaxID=1761880 RepID=UPI00087FFFCE|nr:AraC family transcriptional regulator [Paenibacillus sp. yr247]SDO04327.1 two-component system, response regulator YesN [Paenibacillus sp. yr247]
MWKIAIIDDDRQVLKGMKQVIPWEEIGAEWVGESVNGARGLELIRETKPDIVITDIYMPVMSGLKMIEILREEGYMGRILLHSGYSDFEVARQALRLNVEDYLSKPVSRNTIREALIRTMDAIQHENNIKVEQDKLRYQINLYEPFVRKERLKTAVTGTASDLNEMTLFFQREQEQSQVVLGIEILRTTRISDVRASDRYLFRFAINNIIQEIVCEEKAIFDYVELHGYHAALILYFEKHALYSELIDRIRTIANKIIDCVQKYIHITIRIGIGGLKKNWSNLSDSLEEAFQSLSPEGSIILSTGVFEYASNDNSLSNLTQTATKPMKFYHLLVEDIKNTQGKNAEKIIQNYISTLKQNDNSLQFKVLGAQFWAVLSYALGDEEIRLEDIFQGHSIELELSRIYKVDQYEEWLNDKIRRICFNQQWHENFKHKLAIDFIKQYIHENYAREITIAELAENVYISRNYLSQIFKNATGETINNYIIRVKMEKAKVLLLERKLKIYEVANHVGYNNIPYFSTTFKKYFGITPAEFIT